MRLSEGLLELVRQAMRLDIDITVGAGAVVFESDDGPIIVCSLNTDLGVSVLESVEIVTSMLQDAIIQLQNPKGVITND